MEYLQEFIKYYHITEEELISELKEHAYSTILKKGEYAIKEDEYITLLKIVVKGRIRVYQQYEDKEILVYYLRAMETCILSLSACFEHCKSNVNAVAEENTVLLNIPVRFVKEWSFNYRSWHDFTINTFRESLTIMSFNYSKLAFEPLKNRLLDYIIQESSDSTLYLSHSQLAKELGTTREVISRILKKLEQEKKLVLGQKTIKVLI
ncbi:Crp/Fnr family transcriptional regulator [Aquimarina sp. TRL1]|uniref:Crp/Fnr family transcriptional regulator n=1 Tax=Aquimarina sp. (strain TRL1) TaxID=2736252 RepID=UPI00158C416B|nr:Crp/Fnr family transcriptional regulator [Aquimarina sp. TRL1]QKX05435.1 Crp/Fnr family transcriptional regulator [Aquimarina sp. TRL1]